MLDLPFAMARTVIHGLSFDKSAKDERQSIMLVILVCCGICEAIVILDLHFATTSTVVHGQSIETIHKDESNAFGSLVLLYGEAI
jgi:hypothetical protein